MSDEVFSEPHVQTTAFVDLLQDLLLYVLDGLLRAALQVDVATIGLDPDQNVARSLDHRLVDTGYDHYLCLHMCST